MTHTIRNKARREGWLALTCLLAVLIAVTGFMAYGGNGAGTSAPFRPVLFVDQLGEVSSVVQARQEIGVSFNLPTSLPTGLALASVRTRPDVVALVYYSRTMPGISFYDNATLLILVQKDSTSYSDAAPTNSPSGFLSQGDVNSSVSIPISSQVLRTYPVSISGHQGYGSDPADFPAFLNTGRLDWWSNGIHYTVLADLPLKTLTEIASSMNT